MTHRPSGDVDSIVLDDAVVGEDAGEVPPVFGHAELVEPDLLVEPQSLRRRARRAPDTACTRTRPSRLATRASHPSG